jgi:transposase
MCDIPLSASTQWDVIDGMLPQLEPAHNELIRQAAQGDVVYNDDTKVRILELMGKRAARRAAAAPPSTEDSADAKKKKRTGLFTSGIISTREGRRIALFFSGRQHAGENLHDVLIQRAENRESPI